MPVAFTLSPLTRPLAIVRVGNAVTVPSYTFSGTVTLAVKLLAVMDATTISPVPRV